MAARITFKTARLDLHPGPLGTQCRITDLTIRHHLETGGSGRVRTYDARAFNATLYQLSYQPKTGKTNKDDGHAIYVHGARIIGSILSPYLAHENCYLLVRVAPYPPGFRAAIFLRPDTQHLRWGYDPFRVRSAATDPGHQKQVVPAIKPCSFELPGAYATWALYGVPDEIRTRVLTLRGWRPGPD